MIGQWLRFVVVGVFAAGVNIAARILFNAFVSFEAAVVLAYLVGLTVAFVLNRNYVFSESAGHLSAQYLKFTLVNALALAQVWLISVGLAKMVFPSIGFTWHSDTIAHVIGVASPIVTSFLAYKYFVFPRQAPTGASATK